MTWVEWACTESGQAVIVLVVSNVGAVVYALLKRAGATGAAEKVKAVTASAEGAVRTVTVMAGAIEKAKRDGKITPEEFDRVTQAIRKDTRAFGVEEILAPIVKDVRSTLPPELGANAPIAETVRRATGRLDAPPPSSPPVGAA
jgi:hypothetical protein